MFDNVGSKLKTLAKVLFTIEIIIIVIAFIVTLLTFLYKNIYPYSLSDFEYFIKIVNMVKPYAIAVVVSLVSSWFLYAFGELVEKTSATEANTRNISVTLDALLNSADKFGNTNTDKASAEKTTPKA